MTKIRWSCYLLWDCKILGKQFNLAKQSFIFLVNCVSLLDSFSLSSQYLFTFFLLQWSIFSGDEIRNENAVSFSKNKFFSMACLLVEESDTEIENSNFSYHFLLVLCHCSLLLLIFFDFFKKYKANSNNKNY